MAKEEKKKKLFISLVDEVIINFPQNTLSTIIYEYYYPTIYFDESRMYSYGHSNWEFYHEVRVEEKNIYCKRNTDPWMIVPIVTPKSNYKIMFSGNFFPKIFFLSLKQTLLASGSLVPLDESVCEMKNSGYMRVGSLLIGITQQTLLIVEKTIAYLVYIDKCNGNSIILIKSHEISPGSTLAIGVAYKEQYVLIEPLPESNDPFWDKLELNLKAIKKEIPSNLQPL